MTWLVHFNRSYLTVIEHEKITQSVSYKSAESKRSADTQLKTFCENGYNRQLRQAER